MIGNIVQRLRTKRVKGRSTLILALFMLIFIMALCITTFRRSAIMTTAESMDDSLTVTLLGSAVINMAEYGRTGQYVIHEQLPDRYVMKLGKYNGGSNAELYIDSNEVGYFGNPSTSDEFMVTDYMQDSYLTNAYSKFIELLKENLELDDNMVPISNKHYGNILKRTYPSSNGEQIENKVTVEEYTVINKYRYRDQSFPYMEHTYTVVYRSENGGPFRLVSELSGKDVTTVISNDSIYWSNVIDNGKSDGVEVKETSVYARIKFNIYLFRSTTGEYVSKEQTMDRIVEVKQK